MNIEYKNDFKIKIPATFSAQIIFDMVGGDKFKDFYEKYIETKKLRQEKRLIKNAPTMGSETDKKIKDLFRADSKYFGKVISKIILNNKRI
jgi:hypothetical protein